MPHHTIWKLLSIIFATDSRFTRRSRTSRTSSKEISSFESPRLIYRPLVQWFWVFVNSITQMRRDSAVKITFLKKYRCPRGFVSRHTKKVLTVPKLTSSLSSQLQYLSSSSSGINSICVLFSYNSDLGISNMTFQIFHFHTSLICALFVSTILARGTLGVGMTSRDFIAHGKLWNTGCKLFNSMIASSLGFILNSISESISAVSKNFLQRSWMWHPVPIWWGTNCVSTRAGPEDW